MSAPYLGDFPEDFAGLTFYWSSNAIAGESVTRATNGTISVYKDGGTSQSTAGITDTEDFDSLTGVHKVLIDTSADAFYAAGSEYAAILSAATIDGKTINAPLAHFSIERAGGALALLKGANGLSALKAQTAAIETDTQDIQSRLPAALVGGRMDSNAGAISGDATAADNLEAALDGTGGVTITAALTGNVTGNLSGSVGSVTGAVGSVTAGVSVAVGGIASTSFAAGAVDNAALAADAIGSSELAQSAAQEIADEILNRNLAGGGSGNTRNVRNALRSLRNKVSIAAGTLTVCEEDDSTSAWTAAVATTAGDPISSIDPAGP